MNPRQEVVKMDRERLANILKNAKDCGRMGDIQFVQSVIQYYDNRGYITDGQAHWVKKIEARNCPEEAKKAREWYERIATDERHRSEARIVATYYKNLRQYWVGLAADTLSYLDGHTDEPPNYVQFMKMFDNKYAENVLYTATMGRLWNVGDMVMLRANINPQHAKTMSGGALYSAIQRNLKDKPLMVVEVDCEPIQHALTYQSGRGGCLRYKLLPLGSTETIIVNERDMKKVPKKKLK